MVDPRFEEVKNIVIREASSWESVPQSSVEEAVRVVLPPYKWNTNGMRMSQHGMAGPSREGLNW